MKLLKTATAVEIQAYTQDQGFTLYPVSKKDADSIIEEYPEIEDFLYITTDVQPLIIADFENNIIIPINSTNLELVKFEVERFNFMLNKIVSKEFPAQNLISWTDKKYREMILFNMLDSNTSTLKEDEIYELLIDTYSSLEYIQDYNKFKKLLLEYKPSFENEDEEIQIFRGVTDKSSDFDEALSWTTDIAIAQFFASRFASNGEIFEATVTKKDVLAFIDLRGESEVLVEYKNVKNVKKY